MVVMYGNSKLLKGSYIRNYRGSRSYHKRGEVLEIYICKFWAEEGFSRKCEGFIEK